MVSRCVSNWLLGLSGLVIAGLAPAAIGQDAEDGGSSGEVQEPADAPRFDLYDEPADAPTGEDGVAEGEAGASGRGGLFGRALRGLGDALEAPQGLAGDEPAGFEGDIGFGDFAGGGDDGPVDPALLTEGPDERPEQRMMRLFAELRYAQDAAEADFISEEIEAIWRAEVDPTTKLLTQRAMAAATIGDETLARQLADGAIAMSDGAGAEAYVRSAEIALVGGDLARAMSDLERAVEIDPRRYDALLALAGVFERIDASRGAYEVYGDVLKLYPEHPYAKGRRDSLDRDVFGADM